MLTGALIISSSSLYTDFGTKAKLFDEAVRTYALRCSAIDGAAVTESTLSRVIEQVLADSIDEFGRVEDGCLTSSAGVADTSTSLDVRAYVADLQRYDEPRLRARFDQAVLDADRSSATDPAALAELMQTLWQDFSHRAELGATREELTTVADPSLTLIRSSHHTYGSDAAGHPGVADAGDPGGASAQAMEDALIPGGGVVERRENDHRGTRSNDDRRG